jgi:hypothetical protein
LILDTKRARNAAVTTMGEPTAARYVKTLKSGARAAVPEGLPALWNWLDDLGEAAQPA